MGLSEQFAMRFEEGEASRWQQVPQNANPLLMVRK
jgi:hypothetical protein